MFNSLLFPHVAAPGRELLTIMLGGSEKPEMAAASEAEILSIVHSELAQTLGIRNAEFLQLTRWQTAIPSYFAGHHRLVESLRELSTRHPGLHFLGVDMEQPGIADRIKMALGQTVMVYREGK